MPLSPSLSSRLEFQHQTIAELIEGYSEQELRIRSIADKWSAFENIVHLVLYQLVFQERIVRIIVEKHPSFERYVAENDPSFEEYLHYPVEHLMELLYDIRKQVFRQLHDLSDNERLRTGQHPLFGSLSLIQWTEFFLLHEAHHLFTVFKLLAKR